MCETIAPTVRKRVLWCGLWDARRKVWVSIYV